MAKPIWVTSSLIGKFSTGSVVYTTVIAKPVYPANSITYSFANGSLPPGLTLSPTGVIEGTVGILYANSTFTFTVNALDNFGNSAPRTFTINITLAPNQPVWNTVAGTIGTYASLVPIVFQLSASAVLPAVSITYSIISGSLPSGVTMNEDGLIYGTPSLVTKLTTLSFVVRATDNYQVVKDRTFNISVTGSAIPQITTPEGSLSPTGGTYDSVWFTKSILYTNPAVNNPVVFKISEGSLPPGLEINAYGLIRGYPEPPIINVTLPTIITSATVTETTNLITCLSTIGFTPGRPVVFTGTSVFGGLVAGTTYYVREISSNTEFTVSTTQFGTTLSLTGGTGFMSVTLTAVSVGQPSIRTYPFAVTLESPLGNSTMTYSITVVNQNLSNGQGGPGRPANTRVPAIFNTEPASYTLSDSDPYYGYYVLPVDGKGATYAPATNAPLGTFQSNNYFAFKIIGHDFDGNNLTYDFQNLPLNLVGDSATGWVTGTPSLASIGINQYSFSVAVSKSNNPNVKTDYFNFSFNVAKELTGVVIWITDSNLGSIFNGTISTKSVLATCDTDLTYRIVSGSLPPNLTVLNNGEITGYVADQPTTDILVKGDQTEFTFTIEAFSAKYPFIKSEKTFTLNVIQEYEQPTDILYIKATPSVADRTLIDSLLTDDTLIPTNYLYRPDDVYFGKAKSYTNQDNESNGIVGVVYEHAFGIYASNINQYIAAITKNHYWRNITLGQLETAIARDENGNIIYEVVYSRVVDNLVNPNGISVAEEITWPRPIDLNLGPWYTSVTDVYTSYEKVPPVLGQEYYTSLSPGYARLLYPNSLYNMRTRVAQNLGQEYDSRLLPLWMTSQQINGSTLGYTQAWVICYTQPRILVNGQPLTYDEFKATGLTRSDYKSYAETIKDNIETDWINPITSDVNKLNIINFRIDRFSVNKLNTYNYDTNTSPPTWTGLPSATPVPDPLDSKNFNVLFPRKTILPDETQY